MKSNAFLQARSIDSPQFLNIHHNCTSNLAGCFGRKATREGKNLRKRTETHFTTKQKNPKLEKWHTLIALQRRKCFVFGLEFLSAGLLRLSPFQGVG